MKTAWIVLAFLILASCDKPKEQAGPADPGTVPAAAPAAPDPEATKTGSEYQALAALLPSDAMGNIGYAQVRAGKPFAEAPNAPEITWARVERDLSSRERGIGLLLATASRTTCDFGFGVVGDENTPEAGRTAGLLRHYTRTLVADAGRMALAGRDDDAITRLEAALHVGLHAWQQPDPIFRLTSIALVELASRWATGLYGEGSGRTLTPEQRAKLLAAAERIPADKFGLLMQSVSVNTDRADSSSGKYREKFDAMMAMLRN